MSGSGTDWRRKSVEKALALARQGWDLFCIEELERLLANWNAPGPEPEDDDEPDTIELDLPPKTPEPELPKIEVAHDGSSVTIGDGWDVDDDYSEYMRDWLMGGEGTPKDPRALVRETKALVMDGIKTGKIRRVS